MSDKRRPGARATAMSRRSDRQRPRPSQEPAETVLTLITYDEESFDERELVDLGELGDASAGGVRWLNVAGLEPEGVERVAEAIGLHPLTLEDVTHLGQRPKVEQYDDYLYVILRMLMVRNVAVPTTTIASDGDSFSELKAKLALRQASNRFRRRRERAGEQGVEEDEEQNPPLDEEALRGEIDDPNRLSSEQFSLVLMGNLLITFQENGNDPFGPLRERLREGRGQARSRGADYLTYLLIDKIIDQYFTVAESYGDNLEALEDEILLRPSRDVFAHVNNLRRDLVHVRRAIWPLRDVMGRLVQPDSPLLTEGTVAYMRDAHSHALQVIETVETLREMVTGLHDIYLTVLNTRMNDVIKVLTVISTIFIPLTFLAGIYGMNFESQPEYRLAWAYPALWGLMLALTLAMLWLFRRKGWI